MIGVTSTEGSVWEPVVTADSVEGLVPLLPESCVIILPTAGHRSLVRRQWALSRASQPVPRLFTMPDLYTYLADILQLLPESYTLVSDAEAELLVTAAVERSHEPFRPASFNASRMIRWKMEGLSADYVAHVFPPEERPYDLRDLDRVVHVWNEYNVLCGDQLIDRGGLAQRVVDALARASSVPAMQVLVTATHGLSRVDRMVLHLLARYGSDIGIMFANHPSTSSRSAADTQWLVAHGWHMVCDQEWKAPLQSSHCFASPRTEVRHILGAVKEFVRQGVPINRMCIVLPDTDLYQQLFLEQTDAGVSLSILSAHTPSMMPEATLLYALCTVIINNWQVRDIQRLASCAVLEDTDTLKKLPTLARTYRIGGGMGVGEWTQRIRTQSFVQEADLEVVQRLFKLTSLLPLHGTSQQFADALTTILSGLLSNVPAVLQESLETYSTLSARLHLPQQPLRTHLSQWWSLARNTTTSRTIPQQETLAVLRPNETRMVDFDVVFAPGMVEGVRPVIPKDTFDLALTDVDPMDIEVERWADIQSAARDGVLLCTWPTTLADDPTLRSQFLHFDKSDGFTPEVLNALARIDTTTLQAVLDSTSTVLLSAADVRSYSTSTTINTVERQRGVQAGLLNGSANDLLNEARSKHLSPTRIDTASDCPYRYYAREVLHLTREDVTDESLTALERGELMHAVAQKFFEAVRGRSVNEVCSIHDVQQAQADLTVQPLEAWMPLLEQCYQRLRTSFPQGYLYDSTEFSMMLDTTHHQGLLRRWLTMEYNRQNESPFRPAFFEVTYQGPVNIGDTTEHVNVRIDRIDVAIEGSGADAIVKAVVIDYKTTSNSVPKLNAITAGIRTQPSLYVLATQRWFQNQNINAEVVGMSYHTFGKSVHKDTDPVVKPILPIKKQVDPTLKVAQSFVKGAAAGVTTIRSGSFPVRPLSGVCDRCEYKELCRIESWNIAETSTPIS